MNYENSMWWNDPLMLYCLMKFLVDSLNSWWDDQFLNWPIDGITSWCSTNWSEKISLNHRHNIIRDSFKKSTHYSNVYATKHMVPPLLSNPINNKQIWNPTEQSWYNSFISLWLLSRKVCAKNRLLIMKTQPLQANISVS